MPSLNPRSNTHGPSGGPWGNGALNSQLWEVAQCGNTARVAQLIAEGADVDSGYGKALRSAAKYGHTETVSLLLEHEADIHASDDLALGWAAGWGHTDTVALLLKHGANAHARKDWALHQAALAGHDDVIAVLVQQPTYTVEALEGILRKLTAGNQTFDDCVGTINARIEVLVAEELADLSRRSGLPQSVDNGGGLGL